jgi:ribonuclease VapC
VIHVIDASALLAVARGESGSEVVLGLIDTQEYVISSVNVAEVAARLVDLGLPVSELDKAIAQFNVDTVDFNHFQALSSAEIRPITRSSGSPYGIALALL